MTTVTPFLMFEGRAEEAVSKYVRVLPSSRLLRLERHATDAPGAGTVGFGLAELAGQAVRFFDSPAPHAFSFTPALSLFVEVTSASDFERIVQELVSGGEFLMPPDDYGFSRRFAWLNDEFGVSWQVNHGD